MKLTTSVDVEWQDMSHSCDIPSIELIPYLNVDDHDMYPVIIFKIYCGYSYGILCQLILILTFFFLNNI